MKTEAKVGIFVFAGLVFVFLLSTQVNRFSSLGKEGYRLFASMNNVAGLEKNSKVKLNGIEGGYVKDMMIENSKVKIELFIFKGINIPKDSQIKLSQESMLGSKFVEITLGDSDLFLNDGDMLQSKKEMASFDEASDAIAQAAVEFKKFIKEAREVLDSKSRQNLKNTFANLEKITIDLKEFLQDKKLDKTVANFNTMAKNVSDAGVKFGNMSEDFSKTAHLINDRLPAIMKKVESLSNEFDMVGKNFNKKLPEILEKFSSIENDVREILDENKEPLNNALTSADHFFSKGGDTFEKVDTYLNKMAQSKLEVGLRAEYLANDAYNKNYLTLNYMPNPTRYYMLDIASTDDYSRTDSSGAFIEPIKHEDAKVLISAQMGKRYDNLLLRAGMIESTGGLGADYFMMSDKLKASFEIFDFNAKNDVRSDNAHAKVSLRYTMLKHLDLYAGYDNFLNSKSRNFMLGFGIHFIDDDLKNLLGTANVGSFIR
jgi:phospholipid/cholesterol/gamma-HCH transport system substrate-binding protein